MKQNIKWALLVLLASVCLQSKAQITALDTVRLNKAYDALVKSNYGVKEQQEFFDAFPMSWNEFVMTYDWCPLYKNLYSKHLEHIRAFGKLTAIPQQDYCYRLIWLGCNGQWNADAINFLQDVIRDYTMKNTEAMLGCLETLDDSRDVYQFWRFYFANILPKGDLPEQYAKIKKAIFTHPKLSGADLDLAFISSFGKSTIGFGGGYPHYEEMEQELQKKAMEKAKTAKPKAKGKKNK